MDHKNAMILVGVVSVVGICILAFGCFKAAEEVGKSSNTQAKVAKKILKKQKKLVSA